MDGMFDIRREPLDPIAEPRSAATEVRTALLITVALAVLGLGALLTLDLFGITPFPAVEFPGLQDMGLL